jgi:hypothetical protein
VNRRHARLLASFSLTAALGPGLALWLSIVLDMGNLGPGGDFAELWVLALIPFLVAGMVVLVMLGGAIWLLVARYFVSHDELRSFLLGEDGDRSRLKPLVDAMLRGAVRG